MTIHPWIEKYMITALSIDRHLIEIDRMPFVDHYYGPPLLKDIVNAESLPSLDVLSTAVEDLQNTLPVQDFVEERRIFLEKHLSAMDSMCRMMSGQHWVMREEIENCLDIQPSFIPDDQFEQIIKLLDTALPGSGDIRNRYQQVQARTTLPRGEKKRIKNVVRRILDEIRSRTDARWTLPAGESLDFQMPDEMYGGAANWYLGHFRSRLELNADRPINIFGLIYQMCHEAYPGHHTEFVMKEHYVYGEQGRTEQSIFILGPQLVIAEGIASEAIQMIFTPEELATWLEAIILPEFDIALPDINLTAFVQFSMNGLLDDMSGNFSLMLEAGEPEERIVDYAMAYTPFSEQQIRNYIRSLDTPLKRIYAFSYPYGKRLVQSTIKKAENPVDGFRRLLTQQLYPSALG